MFCCEAAVLFDSPDWHPVSDDPIAKTKAAQLTIVTNLTERFMASGIDGDDTGSRMSGNSFGLIGTFRAFLSPQRGEGLRVRGGKFLNVAFGQRFFVFSRSPRRSP